MGEAISDFLRTRKGGVGVEPLGEPFSFNDAALVYRL